MQVITEAELIAAIEAFLDRHTMSRSTFGSLAKGEAQFLTKLEEGRSPSLRVVQQVCTFMAERDGAMHAAADTSALEESSAGMGEGPARRVSADA